MYFIISKWNKYPGIMIFAWITEEKSTSSPGSEFYGISIYEFSTGMNEE
jgi:hypothetical protein